MTRVSARLGRRIRLLRLDRSLSQLALAAASRLDSKHIQLLESGRGNPTLASLFGVAQGLGVKLAALFEIA